MLRPGIQRIKGTCPWGLRAQPERYGVDGNACHAGYGGLTVWGQGQKQRREGVLASWDVLETFLDEEALERNFEKQAAFEHTRLSLFRVPAPSCHVLTRYNAAGRMTFYQKFRTQTVHYPATPSVLSPSVVTAWCAGEKPAIQTPSASCTH